jgi:hypothetical protein
LSSIIPRPLTDDWNRESGLGISHDIVMSQKPYIRQAAPRLVHTESAPTNALVITTDQQPPGTTLGVRTPRKQRSSEAIKAKRESLEKKRVEGASAESGDDEDEELGRVTSRGKSPLGKAVRTSSKLGQEMMRTNSRGSVISTIDDSAESTTLRKSLEILEERMEGLQIPEEPDQAAVLSLQPRKMERTSSQHSHPELIPERPQSRGHITPPVIFPQQPGDAVKEIDMDSEITPMPTRTMSVDEEELTLRPSDFIEDPTPRPQGSPAGPLSATWHFCRYHTNFFFAFNAMYIFVAVCDDTAALLDWFFPLMLLTNVNLYLHGAGGVHADEMDGMLVGGKLVTFAIEPGVPMQEWTKMKMRLVCSKRLCGHLDAHAVKGSKSTGERKWKGKERSRNRIQRTD